MRMETSIPSLHVLRTAQEPSIVIYNLTLEKIARGDSKILECSAT
jgi:hypothetical protein